MGKTSLSAQWRIKATLGGIQRKIDTLASKPKTMFNDMALRRYQSDLPIRKGLEREILSWERKLVHAMG